MDSSVKEGLSFGLTSGAITTLGLMVGLNSGTHSELVVVGGVLTIAIADAFSDALGMHMSAESSNQKNARQVWEATITTFFAKLVFALTFLVPIFLLPLSIAVLVSIAYGLGVLALMSFFIAKQEKIACWRVIAEHLAIAIVVIIISSFVGNWISATFV
ncbi:MAG: hypothetical protein PHD95_03785 [Candidatus ainarchaeum sp.]|nr:hypothetical protein [Candidatus ainarchaeum sp.]